MLEIKNLKVSAEKKQILKGIDLKVGKGEVHVIMGPNGSGKSTLSMVLAGKEGYKVESGSVSFKGADLLDLKPEERARAGVFLAFQYPVEIPGLSNFTFLKIAVNELRKSRGLDALDSMEFRDLVDEKRKIVKLDEELLERPLNEGFSGGEKKRNEILQMALLEPELAILDETDSGLDIDALKTIAKGINKLRSKDNAIILVTHYQRILDYIVPDFVHVLYKGRIIKSGDKNLAKELEKKGYDFVKDEWEEREKAKKLIKLK